jgi:creatinine amidohydrolase
MLLGELTMKEFRKLAPKAVLVVPFGTVEAHGTHLPLNTDTLIIREAVRKIASERKEVLMAPPVQYGVCTSTAEHPGTIGITTQSLRSLVSDIVRSSYAQGLRRIVLVSGHGGGLHISAMKEASEGLVKELPGLRLAAFSIYEVLGKEAGEIAETRNDSHAGEMETSLMLHLAPGLVNGRAREEYPAFPKPLVVKDKLKYWPGAVWGNPAKATKEKGEKLFRLMVAGLEGVIRAVERAR